MTKPKISLVIVAMNEERTVGKVLEAACNFVDEIIFVDSGSTDRTIEIAKSFEVKLVHQDWLGYSAQKNYAISLASGEWILSLDADEILTPALAEEICEVVISPSAVGVNGFKIPRILHIGSTAITHGGFFPDAQLRLFRKGAGKFNDRLVHEAIFVNGKVGHLHHPMIHMAYADIGEFELAMEKYARLSAEENVKNGFGPWEKSLINELVHPWWTFFYRFILRAGLLDGVLGLKLSLIYSDYVRRKIRYLRQASSKL